MARVALTDDNGALYGAPATWLNKTYARADEVYQAFDGYKMTSGPNVVGTGDSLTFGVGGNGTDWPGALGSTIASAYTTPGEVTNLGVGGENSATISGRVGLGNPWLATVAGGSIPTTGGVTVTLVSSDGADVAPLVQAARGVNPVQIAGVEGTLSLSSGVYTFTRTTDGTAVAVPDPVEVSTQAQRDRQSDIFVMWWGQNDGTTNAETIIARQRATVSRLRAFSKRWLVLGLSSGSEASRAAMDAQFETAHGERFINIREYLSSTDALQKEGISPTAEDNTAISNGSVPPSFLSDNVHLNAAGYRRVGRAVYERIKALGWNDQWGVLGDDADVYVPLTYFSDDFERTSTNIIGSTTPVGGRTWAIFSGGAATVPIDAGALAISLNGDAEAIPHVNGGTANGVFEAILRTAGGGNPVIAARLVDQSNMIRVQGVSGSWQVNQRINASTTTLASGIGTVANGDIVRITLNGTSCTVHINGTQAWTGTVVENAAGTRYGFQSFATGANVRWESFKLTESV